MEKDGRTGCVTRTDKITKRIQNEIGVGITVKEEQHVERTE